METNMENYIPQLLEVLDVDVANIRNDIDVLKDLREKLIKRDEEAMMQLLENTKNIVKSRKANEQKRFAIRKKLAEILKIPVQELTISKLITKVGQRYSAELTHRRNSLAELVEKFKTQHEATVFLVSDCARFNSLLLRNLLNLNSNDSATYKPGKIDRSPAAAFVNLQY